MSRGLTTDQMLNDPANHPNVPGPSQMRRATTPGVTPRRNIGTRRSNPIVIPDDYAGPTEVSPVVDDDVVVKVEEDAGGRSSVTMGGASSNDSGTLVGDDEGSYGDDEIDFGSDSGDDVEDKAGIESHDLEAYNSEETHGDEAANEDDVSDFSIEYEDCEGDSEDDAIRARLDVEYPNHWFITDKIRPVTRRTIERSRRRDDRLYANFQHNWREVNWSDPVPSETSVQAPSGAETPSGTKRSSGELERDSDAEDDETDSHRNVRPRH